MDNVLKKIVATKREEIATATRRRPLREMQSAVADAPPVRSFPEALRQADGVALIAEVKKASPSAGVIRADFDPVQIAKHYTNHGATCLSVLTDEPYFQGKLDFLIAVRQAVTQPVLRKDFLLDPYQIYEARAAGADCVLLIAECLEQSRLAELHALAGELGMSTLIEIYQPDNLERVLDLQPEILGVNNRNLETFVTDLSHSLHLRPRVPADVLFVSESGIRTPADVQRLSEANVDAMLVGESLMREEDIGTAVRTLLSGNPKSSG